MKLSKGKFYLFEERVPLRTHQVLRKELDKGRKALYISKNPPRLLRSQLDFDEHMLETMWLSTRPNPIWSAKRLANQAVAAPLANMKPSTRPPIMPLRAGKKRWPMMRRMLCGMLRSRPAMAADRISIVLWLRSKV